MASKKCVSCGRDLNSDIQFCPYCGAPQTKGFQTQKAPDSNSVGKLNILGIGVILLFLSIIFWLVSLSSEEAFFFIIGNILFIISTYILSYKKTANEEANDLKAKKIIEVQDKDLLNLNDTDYSVIRVWHDKWVKSEGVLFIWTAIMVIINIQLAKALEAGAPTVVFIVICTIILLFCALVAGSGATPYESVIERRNRAALSQNYNQWTASVHSPANVSDIFVSERVSDFPLVFFNEDKLIFAETLNIYTVQFMPQNKLSVVQPGQVPYMYIFRDAIQAYLTAGDIHFGTMVTGGGGGGYNYTSDIHIESQEIKHDLRETVIRYYDQNHEIQTYHYPDVKLYEFLLRKIPEKDFDMLKAKAGASAPDAEERLNQLEKLYRDHLISEEEYHKRRKDIVDSI